MSDLPYRPCVGVMLVNADGRVFTGKRIDNPGPAWQMPQGGIDAGEDATTAALRELWEETGVTADKVSVDRISAGTYTYDLPPELLGKMWGGKYRGQIQTWVLLRFNGTDSDVNIATDHPEFSEWRWSDVDQLVPDIVPFKRDVYAGVLREFADSL
ncbi:RNA pyrophosphohydrolase [Ketogulonicigenium vulgare]|uniref:RNA pyrophosphohydrolase n=1 Tax=Ketogulonicigenium vulgare (strain WSH-001) TaxID=759362 RepID=F9Y5P3_KETVW|nr:RNA pyrophosphohydrolase [Ketogulonicigenium vulgare]ADO43699.1 hydrolase, NUDIX family, NudH subfamily protein [Ketogulonicigenium vulgare Y25]AEM41968.1 Hydrolase, NUDIX family, NudH subfamily protein [Ketogulonicigenium vulgare WSH-001]ALJ82067.1 RNA pyrophosphohydrolase [Ketogulonicigenium vulgare]ANW34694.1 RNA pyrophosphohydrolase [Ketogulonicigenium vulgare]AOZ55733.1 hydrolase, NUDIX family, NudH subfamily protein [Ketogulonicigenium vulgare]